MNRERLVNFLCVAVSALLGGCALIGSSNGSSASSIELTQDAFVSGDKMPRALRKKGEKVALTEGAPVVVEWPGMRTVLVMPAAGQAEAVKITLKPLDGAETAANPRSRQRIGSELNRLIAKVNEVQWLSATKRTDVALKTLEDLESVYPDVTYLGFMKASLLVLRGDQQKAIAALESALREFPENESGQNLYRKLSGIESKSKARTPSTLLDDELLDMSSDTTTLDTTSTPGAAVPPLPSVETKPAAQASSALPSLLPSLLPPPPAAAPPPLPKSPGQAPAFPSSLPTGAEEAFGEDL